MPNPESLILNILLWNIIKMTHQIAFVNYWIMLVQQVFRKAPFIIEINWYRKHWLSYSYMNIFAPKETLPTYSYLLQPS